MACCATAVRCAVRCAAAERTSILRYRLAPRLFLAPSFPDVCIDQYHLIDVAGLVVQYPIMFATDQLSVGREHNRVARALPHLPSLCHSGGRCVHWLADLPCVEGVFTQCSRNRYFMF